MTGATTTHVKLGLLAIAGLLGVVAAGLGLGLRGARSATISYRTYFDESVQGLEIGAPVKYRGVRIGNTSTIEVAPDRKHVAVGLALFAGEAGRLGLADRVPELRTQLATQGVTGIKFVEIDFCDPATNPLPRLPFPPGDHYVPARASMMKGLEDNLEAVGQRLPELVDRAVSTLTKIELVLDDLHGQRVPHRIADVIAGISGAAADVRRLAQHLDRAQVGNRAATALDGVDGAVARLSHVLDRIDGDA
ncbi:MAG TPA: MlaD family protein, partial [Kofleriaceae bacterium]